MSEGKADIQRRTVSGGIKEIRFCPCFQKRLYRLAIVIDNSWIDSGCKGGNIAVGICPDTQKPLVYSGVVVANRLLQGGILQLPCHILRRNTF